MNWLFPRSLPGTAVGSHYGRYAGEASAGLLDGFITRGHVSGRSPYDIWERSGGGCDRSAGSVCAVSFALLLARMTRTPASRHTANAACIGWASTPPSA